MEPAERRHHRSPFRFPAATHYLHALVRRESLAAAVLSDEDGPIAGRSPIGADLDEVANLGALGLRGSVVRDVGDVVWAQTLRIAGRTLLLTTVGGRVERTNVEADLSRIFACAS